MGSIQLDWKGYHKIDGKLYQVVCTDTEYITDSILNIFSVTHALTKGLK